MHEEHPPHAEVEGWLKALGVESLCQWDVLVFLHGHRASLLGADHLGRLLGYATEQVIATLDALESLGLVERSRVSGGASLYQFTGPPDGPRSDTFERLLDLAVHRAGRLLLYGRLQQGDRNPPQGPEAARRVSEPNSSAGRLRSGPRSARRGANHGARGVTAGSPLAAGV
jgi:hypothetical protein